MAIREKVSRLAKFQEKFGHLRNTRRAAFGPLSAPVGPDVREFFRLLVGSSKKRFDRAKLTAGYDAGGKGLRVIICVRSPSRELGRKLSVDRNIVESTEAIL